MSPHRPVGHPPESRPPFFVELPGREDFQISRPPNPEPQTLRRDNYSAASSRRWTLRLAGLPAGKGQPRGGTVDPLLKAGEAFEDGRLETRPAGLLTERSLGDDPTDNVRTLRPFIRKGSARFDAPTKRVPATAFRDSYHHGTVVSPKPEDSFSLARDPSRWSCREM